MAFPTAVNDQITDATLAGPDASAATGNFYQRAANAMALALEDAVYAQQQLNVLYQAATAQGVMLLYSADATGGKISAPPDGGAAASASTTSQPLAQLQALAEQAATVPGTEICANLSIGLAMLNVVNQQQHLNILESATLVAAIRATLPQDPREALALMQEYKARHASAEQLGKLQALLDPHHHRSGTAQPD